MELVRPVAQIAEVYQRPETYSPGLPFSTSFFQIFGTYTRTELFELAGGGILPSPTENCVPVIDVFECIPSDDAPVAGPKFLKSF